MNKLDKAYKQLRRKGSNIVEACWWNHGFDVGWNSIVVVLNEQRTSTGAINDVILDCDLLIDRVDKNSDDELVVELRTLEAEKELRLSFKDKARVPKHQLGDLGVGDKFSAKGFDFKIVEELEEEYDCRVIEGN